MSCPLLPLTMNTTHHRPIWTYWDQIQNNLKLKIKVTRCHSSPGTVGMWKYTANTFPTPTLERDEWPPPPSSRPGRFTSVQENLQIVGVVGWVSGPVLTCMKNLVLKKLLTPKRQAVKCSYTEYMKCRRLIYSLSRWTGLKHKEQL